MLHWWLRTIVRLASVTVSTSLFLATATGLAWICFHAAFPTGAGDRAIPVPGLGRALLIGILGVLIVGLILVGPVIGLRVAARILRWVDRRARYSVGLCRRCGYDLYGNVPGRCPECGTEI